MCIGDADGSCGDRLMHVIPSGCIFSQSGSRSASAVDRKPLWLHYATQGWRIYDLTANSAIISIFMLGLNLAFDRRILIDYFASRLYTYVYILIATKLANVKESLAVYASAFADAVTPKTLSSVAA